MRLAGKIALITAAGSGMGRAASIRFAREGAKVAVVDVDPEKARQTVETIQQAGGEACAIVADLTQAEENRRIVTDAVRAFGGLDILWNHAGGAGPIGIEDVTVEAYERAMDLNLRSGFFSTQAAVPEMQRRGGGAILFTSSISGLIGSERSPIYAGAKFGVVGFTKSLALSLGQYKIRVNCICPGTTDTPMLPTFFGAQSPEELEKTLNQFKQQIPLGRAAAPEEIAAAGLFLASDEAGFITGVALPVDGGYTAR